MAESADRTLTEEWIYAEHRIQGGFDRELVEKHAEKQLERAINSRRLIAVTGSGLSATYALPSWASLLRNIASTLKSMLDELINTKDSSVRKNLDDTPYDGDLNHVGQNPIKLFGHRIEPRYALYIAKSYRNIKRARDEESLDEILVERAKIKSDAGEDVVAKCLNITSLIESFVGNRLLHIGDDFPKENFHLYFEICENLYAELYVFALDVSGEPTVSYRTGLHKARRYLRERLKWQLRDERGRCEILFTELGLAGRETGGHALAELFYPAEIDATAPGPLHDLRAALFSQVFYGRIGPEDLFAYAQVCSAAQYDELILHFATLRRFLKFPHPEGKPGERVLDSINHIGLIEYLFCARSDGERETILGVIFKIVDLLAKKSEFAGEVLQQVRVKTPHHRDPIAILARDLRIRRFLTTNYDSEIDKWLEAQGYHELSTPGLIDPTQSEVDTRPVVLASRSIYDDRYANRAEILAYEPGAAAHLYTYGSDTRDNHLKVLHIHGRCRAKTSWLVLSERDYRERYARDDDPRARSDDAMRLIFNANPLLFLGLGMSEADILRPLRTYSEAAASLSDRPAIALLPRLDDKERSALEAAKAMSSYGIYYLYYGSAITADKALGDAEPKTENLLKVIFDLTRCALDFVVDGENPTRQILKEKRKKLMGARRHLERREILTVEGSKIHARDLNHLCTGLLAIVDDLISAVGAISEKNVEPKLKIGFRNALAGYQSAIISTFFCARLKRLVTDTAEWKDDWSVAPAPRQRFGRPNPGEGAKNPDPRYSDTRILTSDGLKTVKRAHEATRHMIVQRNLEEEALLADPGAERLPEPDADKWTRRGAPQSDRFFAGAPSHAVINLRYSIEAAKLVRPTQSRLFLFLGSRGAGRGNVFSSLRSDRRFAYFCQWLRILNGVERNYPTDLEAIDATKNIPRVFFNLGLSHEIVMVFDRMIWFLESLVLEHALEEDRAALKFRCRKLHNQRIERLKNAMQLLSTVKLGEVQRIVIAINNLSVFYNEDGEAKNSQVKRLIETLLSPKYKSAPIDFLFFASDDTPLPNILTGRRKIYGDAHAGETSEEANVQSFFPLLPIASNEAGWAQRMAYFESLHLNLVPSETVETSTRCFVHKLEPAQPVALAIRFFPKVALALFYLGRVTEGGTTQSEWLSHGGMVNLGLLSSRRERVRVEFAREYMEDYGLNQPKNHLFILDETVIQTALRDNFERKFNLKLTTDEGRAFRARVMKNGIDGVLLSFMEFLLVKAGEKKAERDASGAKDRFLKIGTSFIRTSIETFFNELDKTPNDAARDEDKKKQAKELQVQTDGGYYFRRLRSLTGHNRFCMTIILAAIDDMMDRRSETKPRNLVELSPIIQFIDRLSNAVSGQAPERRADTVIELVLNNYKSDIFNSLSRRMSPWPRRFKALRPDASAIFNVAEKEESVTKAIYDLQDAILSTLSLIGQPVRASALLGAPDVARQADHLIRLCGGYKPPEQANETPEQKAARDQYKRRCINLFMDLLVHRCLVFRLLSTTDASKENYFSLQKTIRRYFLNRMNAPNIDMASVDQLTVSSYTSQPDDLPKPTAEGNRRIRHLIERLSGFESQSYQSPADPYLNPTVRRDKAEAEKVERLRLRAAFGALRSFYSLGVISRFSTFADEGLPTPDYGYFEAHRLRVRWMLRKAKAIDGAWNRVNDDNEEIPVLRTFYAEEIVWMFNECGVLSLAQGRINDSLSLLTQAQIVARDFIEGSGWGSLHAHIGLNLAVAHIEKGHLQAANRLLGQITENGETQALTTMAMGYQALIRAYQGELGGAVRQLQDVSRTLTDLDLYRAAAIFLNYRAQLLLQAGADLNIADRSIFDALNLATNGGHEDIRQKALLTQTWLKVKQLSQNRNGADKVSVHSLLDQVESYGKIMGIPRIVSRAELVRSEFFFAEGEFRMSAEAAQRSLGIATRFDLELRKISSLNRLGLAMARMHLPESKVLLIQAREMASQIEFNMSLKEIEYSLSQLGMVS